MAGGRVGTLLPPSLETQVQDEGVKRQEEDDADEREDANANSSSSQVEAFVRLNVHRKKDCIGRGSRPCAQGSVGHHYEQCGSASRSTGQNT